MGHLTRYLRQYSHETFSSLYVRNYRLYYIGQIISTSGTFMQSVAQAWLVLQLTNSGTALGIATALQYVPILILGPYGGVIADRFSKRKILYLTQSLSGILALILGVLVATRLVKVWMVYILAFCLGMVTVFDNPTRQTLYMELVGPEQPPERRHIVFDPGQPGPHYRTRHRCGDNRRLWAGALFHHQRDFLRCGGDHARHDACQRAARHSACATQ